MENNREGQKKEEEDANQSENGHTYGGGGDHYPNRLDYFNSVDVLLLGHGYPVKS